MAPILIVESDWDVQNTRCQALERAGLPAVGVASIDIVLRSPWWPAAPLVLVGESVARESTRDELVALQDAVGPVVVLRVTGELTGFEHLGDEIEQAYVPAGHARAVVRFVECYPGVAEAFGTSRVPVARSGTFAAVAAPATAPAAIARRR